MVLYIVGISCVGKSTIGRLLAEKIGFQFYDLDEEVEKYYGMPIEKIQDSCLTMNGFRDKASLVLDLLFSKEKNIVVAGTPSGLKFAYLQVYKKHKNKNSLYSIYLQDICENVIERITFYDKDSNPIEIILDDDQKKDI